MTCIQVGISSSPEMLIPIARPTGSMSGVFFPAFFFGDCLQNTRDVNGGAIMYRRGGAHAPARTPARIRSHSPHRLRGVDPGHTVFAAEWGTAGNAGRGLRLEPEGRQLFLDHTVMEILELGAHRRLRAGAPAGWRRRAYLQVNHPLARRPAPSGGASRRRRPQAGRGCAGRSIGLPRPRAGDGAAAMRGPVLLSRSRSSATSRSTPSPKGDDRFLRRLD